MDNFKHLNVSDWFKTGDPDHDQQDQIGLQM